MQIWVMIGAFALMLLCGLALSASVEVIEPFWDDEEEKKQEARPIPPSGG